MGRREGGKEGGREGGKKAGCVNNEINRTYQSVPLLSPAYFISPITRLPIITDSPAVNKPSNPKFVGKTRLYLIPNAIADPMLVTMDNNTIQLPFVRRK